MQDNALSFHRLYYCVKINLHSMSVVRYHYSIAFNYHLHEKEKDKLTKGYLEPHILSQKSMQDVRRYKTSITCERLFILPQYFHHMELVLVHSVCER